MTEAWAALLDRLEGELDGTVDPVPFVPPRDIGPLPLELAQRALTLQARIAAAEADALRSLAVLRQESALIGAPLDETSRFVDVVA